MNNYEQRLFLSYLDKLLPHIDLDCYTFNEQVFDFIIDEFKLDKNKFKLDKYGNPKTDTKKQKNEFISVMRKKLNKYKKALPAKNTLLEKQLNILKDIYFLNEDEFEIVQFFIIREVNKMFYTFFECMTNNGFDIFIYKYLGLRYGKRERMLNELSLRELIYYIGRRNDYNANPKIIKIFDDKRCNTPNKILRTVLGDQERTNLSLRDFEYLKEDRKKVITILSSAAKNKAKGINILLHGGVGTGKTEFAKLIAKSAKIPMYAVSSTDKDDLKEEASRKDRLIDLYSKQYILSRLGQACILFDEAEDVMNRGFSVYGSASKSYMNNLLDRVAVPVIWTTNNIEDVDPAFLRRMTYCIEFEKLTEDMRLNIWNRVLKKNNLCINSDKVSELNRNYDIPPSLIANAVQTTKMIGGDENDFENLIENVARVVTKKKNVKKKKEFEMREYDEALVNSDINIRELTSKIKQCGRLNFSLCLYGEPGTGKSLYARYLAKQLGIEVILKRASDLMSMWVGGTEHNIAEAFAEAKSKKAMLIFDEADSFLQNRTNAVRNWEVTQVNEMLTWMESHEYPFVCTTNLLDSLDEASLRRFTFKIRFDFMSSEQVNNAINHFFGIENSNVNIKGLTAGDFSTVKKKVDFLGINDLNEITRMLQDEVKVKKSKTLQNTVGF